MTGSTGDVTSTQSPAFRPDHSDRPSAGKIQKDALKLLIKNRLILAMRPTVCRPHFRRKFVSKLNSDANYIF